MSKSHPWGRFFDGHASQYLQNDFTKNTLAEVDFLLRELGLAPQSEILDIGCGVGRHAIELARRGHHVTGVDISAGMLDEARRAARVAGVTINWVCSDAREIALSEQFDAAISLCEGAFGLLDDQDDAIEHDERIARRVFDALRPGAPFMLTTLNGLRQARGYSQDDVRKGAFNPLTMTETELMKWEDAAGPQEIRGRQRGYVPTELTMLLRNAGFAVRGIFGGTAGAWGRRPLDLDEIEMMVICDKPDLAS
ncbi:MAG: class I SAM-dependent methyltransferase [Phycisphaerales bacterium]|nr:class I SAM-dependent methyltransferase [Phycisphaerales bacterium]